MARHLRSLHFALLHGRIPQLLRRLRTILRRISTLAKLPINNSMVGRHRNLLPLLRFGDLGCYS